MRKVRKILSILALIVLVGSDFLTSFSYALEDIVGEFEIVHTEIGDGGEIEDVGENGVEESKEETEDEKIEEENGAQETVEGATGAIVEELTGFVEELTGTVDENIGTGEETIIEEKKYNEEPIIGEKIYNDVTVRVEVLPGIFPEGAELMIEPMRSLNLSSLKDKLVEEKEEIKKGNDGQEFSTTLEGDDSARNNFHYKTITISDGTHAYTLMDRNLGARVAWDPSVEGNGFYDDNSENYDTASDYYGYYYQWGNNWGFSAKTTSVGATSEVVVPDSDMPSKYSNSNWNSYVPWSAQYDLWGEVTDTESARKGPCPTGWHVPTSDEWKAISDAWCVSAGKGEKSCTACGKREESCKTGQEFAEALQMPTAGGRNYEDLEFNNRGEFGLYWTSSTPKDGFQYDAFYPRRLYFESYRIVPLSSNYRSYGYPIRCLKNSSSIFTLTFERNNGEVATTQQVTEGQTATEPIEPTKENYNFAGWYTSTDGGQTLSDTVFDFDTPIMADITLYAKWVSCENGEIYAPESGKCVARWHELVSLTNGNTTTTVGLDDPVEGFPSTMTVIENDILDSPEGDALSEAEGKELAGDVTIDFDGENAKFSHLVKVKIPVKGSSKAYVKVKHVGSDEYNYDGLTTHREASCDDGRIVDSDDKYDGEYMDVEAGYVSIYTCEASSFAAFGLEEITGFEVTIVSNNPNYGTVDVSPVIAEVGAVVSANSNVLTIENTTPVIVTATPTTAPTNYSNVLQSWDTSDCGDTITQDCQIIANFAQIENGTSSTVTFDANRGAYEDKPADQTVNNGSTVTEPTLHADFRLPGYNFAGWYTEAKGGRKWDFANDIITQDTTLYAHWEYDLEEYPFGDLDVYILDANGDISTYVMMDRNIGAKSNDITLSDSYGYVYQWGNNWGFERCRGNGTTCHGAGTSNPNISTSQVDKSIWSNYYNSKYASKTWIYVNKDTPWQKNPDVKDNLWGGESDEVSDKQGPCPDGYYVPLKVEFNDIISKWSTLKGYNITANNGFSDVVINDFTHNFLWPLAGAHRKGEITDSEQGGCAEYWTSVTSDTKSAKNIFFCKVGANTWFDGAGNRKYDTNGAATRNNGSTVRCFKNTDTTNLSIKPDKGKGAVITVDKVNGTNTIIALTEPSRSQAGVGDLHFDGWFTDPGFDPSTKKEARDPDNPQADPTIYTLSPDETALYAKWSCPQEGYEYNGVDCASAYNITFDANEGSFDVEGEFQNTQTKGLIYGVTYNYSDLPTPTRPGFAFKGWYADFDGVDDYVDYGTDFKFSDKISIHLSAYMDNWSEFTNGNSGKRIISCINGDETEGWAIKGKEKTKIQFACVDSSNWKSATSSDKLWSSLESGWHDFDVVFDGQNARLYLDGDSTALATSQDFTSGKLKYNSTNSILLGAQPETSNTPYSDDPAYFHGKIKDVIIQNSDQRITSTDALSVPHQDVTYYALWEEMSDGTVTFQSNNLLYGTVSESTVTKPYGTEIVENQDKTLTIDDVTVTATPSSSTAQYTYSFDGWTFSQECGTSAPYIVAEGCTVTATFTPVKRSYTITWLNDDDSVIDTTTVEYGVVPTHADAVKASTDEYSYTFAGRDPELVAVTGEKTYKATFTPVKRSYTITWLNDDGTVLETDEDVLYGTTPTYDGATPTKAATAQYTYTHNGWSPAVGAIEGDTVYTAQFSETTNKYTVTWNYKDANGDNVTTTTNVAYGTTPTRPTVIPTTITIGNTTYTLKGWEPELGEVTGETTYTAVYTEKKKDKESSGGNMSGGGGRGGNTDSNDDQNGPVEDENNEMVVDWENGSEFIGSGDFTKQEDSLYKWAKQNGITTMDSLEGSDPEGLLTRGHLAKMVVNFMVNVQGRKVPYDISYECLNWNDNPAVWESEEIKYYATRACAFGVMGIDMWNNEFLPDKLVTRAEFGTVVSRILYGDTYNLVEDGNVSYYENHLKVLKNNDIITQIENPEYRREIRKWVWLVFRRVLEKNKS